MILRNLRNDDSTTSPTRVDHPGDQFFPVRKRAFSRRFEMFEQYFQHFPGFGGRYRVAETTRSHQNDENVEN